MSYYDYYQPEAYVPSTDTYIEKDASINDEIDKMRHAATKALLERNDVLVVASVSCIYGLGSPASYFDMLVDARARRHRRARRRCCASWSTCSTSATTTTSTAARSACAATWSRSTRRTRRAAPSASSSSATRWSRSAEIDPLRGKVLRKVERVAVYPASHYVATAPTLKKAVDGIRIELKERLAELRDERKLLEAQRLEQRTHVRPRAARGDGLLPGIENYSRHLDGREPGEPPYTLLDYFPEDFLLVVDESHVTIPQIGGMYRGDRSRKETLVDFGFRLPSALDNRPLNFEEFLSARSRRRSTSPRRPGDWERAHGEGSRGRSS